ncbi:MAG: hypothetical protein J7D61_07925 [Marichromatium sp.]|nr:hypothetical protein [Marichromatium sp.]
MKLDPLTYEVLAADQRRLEEEMIAASRSRFWAAVERARAGRATADQGWARAILVDWLQPVQDAIAQWADEASSKRGTRPRLLTATAILDVEVVAFIAVRVLLNEALDRRSPPNATPLGLLVGRDIERETLLLQQSLQDGGAKLDALAKARPARLRAELKKIDAMCELSQTELIALGGTLLDLIVHHTELVEYDMSVTNDKRQTRVMVTEAALQRIEAHLDRLAEAPHVGYWPMVCPPRQWSPSRKGGYLTKPARHRYDLITHTLGGEPAADRASAEVYQALNAMQDTAFRINVGVLEVLDTLLAADAVPPKLDPGTGLAWPEAPDVEGIEENSSEWKAAWRGFFRAQEAIQEQYDKLAGAAREGQTAIAMAHMFKGYARLWFPHRLDFRGRAYPVVHALQPQGGKVGAGLLELAEGMEVGEEGLRWLKIHAANVFGFDKAPFDGRVAWAEEHTEMMLRVARDPVGTMADWGKADKPYHFLAVCLEWPSVVEHGPAHVSRVPVQMDGSCNGLQHLSAISRDPSTARLVNLVDSATPNDVYGTVAETVTDALREIAKVADGEERAIAEAWLAFGIDRKLTKRSVMTLPYGSTLHSTGTFIRDAVMERGGFKALPPGTELQAAVSWLKPIMWEAIKATIPGARLTMDWLQGSTKAASAADLPVTWATPDGFVVVQDYRVQRSKQLRIHTTASSLRLRVNEPTQEIDANRQRNGMAPNFIHSMDACAMRGYIRKAQAAGITAFVMIHDSYGTHAANVGLMQRLLREAFAEMYAADVTRPLLEALAAQGTPYEEPLETGRFDVDAVKTSSYFFA